MRQPKNGSDEWYEFSVWLDCSINNVLVSGDIYHTDIETEWDELTILNENG